MIFIFLSNKGEEVIGWQNLIAAYRAPDAKKIVIIRDVPMDRIK